jgi:hypothetical protein
LRRLAKRLDNQPETDSGRFELRLQRRTPSTAGWAQRQRRRA